MYIYTPIPLPQNFASPFALPPAASTDLFSFSVIPSHNSPPRFFALTLRSESTASIPLSNAAVLCINSSSPNPHLIHILGSPQQFPPTGPQFSCHSTLRLKPLTSTPPPRFLGGGIYPGDSPQSGHGRVSATSVRFEALKE